MAKKITVYGDASLVTGAKKFGSASLALDGKGDFINIGVNNDFNFNTGDYTIEGFFNFSSIDYGYKNTLFSKEDNDNRDFVLYYDLTSGSDTSGALVYETYYAQEKLTGEFTPETGSWYHIAVTKRQHVLGHDTDLFIGGKPTGRISDSWENWDDWNKPVGNQTSNNFYIGHTADEHNVPLSVDIGGTTFTRTKSPESLGGFETLSQINSMIAHSLGGTGWTIADWDDFTDFSKEELDSLAESFGMCPSGSVGCATGIGWMTYNKGLSASSEAPLRAGLVPSSSLGRDRLSRAACFYGDFRPPDRVGAFIYDYDIISVSGVEKYWTLSSKHCSIPERFVAKKDSSLVSDPEYKDFHGYVDEFRVVRGRAEYAHDWPHLADGGEGEITGEFVNDAETVLLLHFNLEGSNDTKIADTSSADLTIISKNINLISFHPSSASVGGDVTLFGESLHKVDSIFLSGIPFSNPQAFATAGAAKMIGVSDFEKLDPFGLTGLKFTIPQGALNNQAITITNLDNITGFGINGEVFYETSVSTGKLGITDTVILSVDPSSGKYEDIVSVSGSYIPDDAEFLFVGYKTGLMTNYIKSLSTTIVNNTGADIQVPREIVEGNIYVSGADLFQKTNLRFTPIPTVSGINETDFEIGDSFSATILNGTDAIAVLGITGKSHDGSDTVAFISKAQSGFDSTQHQGIEFDLNVIGNTRYDYSSIDSNYPESSKTGHLKLTGTITNQFVGTGNLFVLSSTDVGAFDAVENKAPFSDTEIYSTLSSYTGEQVTVTEKAPILSGISPSSGNLQTEITVSGDYLLSITGIKYSGDEQECVVPYNDLVYNANVSEPSRFTLLHSGNIGKNSYEQVHSARFNMCMVLPSGTGSIHLMSPNYTTTIT